MGLISRVSSRTYRKKALKMRVFVEDQIVDVVPSTTIAELKTKIGMVEGRLVTGTAQLDDDEETLENFGVVEDTNIQVLLPLLGGGRKRKKKVYTTPKKIKHKRVKVKLATLKMYKVDDNGKLERKRKECPHETCGADIFMSNHKDRHYCGKCQLTMKFDKNGKSPFA